MPVFEVLGVEQPTKKDREEGAIERIVFRPKLLVARSDQAAAIAAVAGAAKDLEGVDQNRLDVNVRPF